MLWPRCVPSEVFGLGQAKLPSHLQVLGYFVKFGTDENTPPLCAVVSEKNMQLVCFPYAASGSAVVDCLVLPELPFFLNVTVTGTSPVPTIMINRYLLALILLWTKHEGPMYSRGGLWQRQRLHLTGGTKKKALQKHIQSMAELAEEEKRVLQDKVRSLEETVEDLEEERRVLERALQQEKAKRSKVENP